MVDRVQFHNQNQIFGSQQQQPQPIATQQPQPPKPMYVPVIRQVNGQQQRPRLVSVQRAQTSQQPNPNATQQPQPLRYIPVIRQVNGQPQRQRLLTVQRPQTSQQQQAMYARPIRRPVVYQINDQQQPSGLGPIQRNQASQPQAYQNVYPQPLQQIIKTETGQASYQVYGYPQQQPRYVQRIVTGPPRGVVMQHAVKQEIIDNSITMKNGYTEISQNVVIKQEQECKYIPNQSDTHLPHPTAFVPPLPPIDEGNVDIHIHNVVCNFSLPMHIDLRKFALNSWNSTYDRAGTILSKQERKPNCHVKIYSSGKVHIVGCKTEAESYRAARMVGRKIQKVMGKTDKKIRLQKFRVNNILATCKLGFGILINEIARKYPKESEYEPELTIGLVWRMTEPKATIRIYTSGTIAVTGATSEADVQAAFEKIYNVVKEFRCDPRSLPPPTNRKRAAATTGGESSLSFKRQRSMASPGEENDEMEVKIFDDEDDLDDLC